ncbi:hypothetical protein Q8A73_021090 [Channa argus]|nr:hypothetical protein Q8A73_021090 [Channa argus]
MGVGANKTDGATISSAAFNTIFMSVHKVSQATVEGVENTAASTGLMHQEELLYEVPIGQSSVGVIGLGENMGEWSKVAKAEKVINHLQDVPSHPLQQPPPAHPPLFAVPDSRCSTYFCVTLKNQNLQDSSECCTSVLPVIPSFLTPFFSYSDFLQPVAFPPLPVSHSPHLCVSVVQI